MALLKKEDFYNTFFQKDKISPVFSKICYKYNNSIFYSSKNREANHTAKVNFISLFPQYLYPEIANTKKLKVNDLGASSQGINKKKTLKFSKQASEHLNLDYRVKRIQQKKLDGFGVLIDGLKDVDTYLINTFKSSTRGPIKKKIKRLESCFNIHSKMFYGDIKETEYHIIMPQLKAMIERRFIQRNNANEALGKWDLYLNSTLAQIKNKEASLFVLYADEDIIGISLNYHINKIFIGHIIAYNIDYSKFGLGNTIVYKLLEWSIKNNYAIFDMGNGALDYKRIWSNFAYNYDYYIVYNKLSIDSIFGQLQVFKVQFKNLLKEYNVVDNYRKIKARFFSTRAQPINLPKSLKFEAINNDVFKSIKSTKIKYHDIQYKTIKKAVIDFAFAQQDHISNIEVFKADNAAFIIKGKKSIQKIIID